MKLSAFTVIILMGLYGHSQVMREHETFTGSRSFSTGTGFGSPGSWTGSDPLLSWDSPLSDYSESLGEPYMRSAERSYQQGNLVDARKDLVEALSWGATGHGWLESRNWLRGLDQRILDSAREHIQSHEWATAHDELGVLLVGQAQQRVREEALQLIQLADEPVFLGAQEAFAAKNWEVAATGFGAIRFGKYPSFHKAEAGRLLAAALLHWNRELQHEGLWQFAAYILNSFGNISEASRAEQREAHRLEVSSYQRWGEEAYRQHDWRRALDAFRDLRTIAELKGEEDPQAANLAEASLKRIHNIRTIPQALSKQSVIVDVISDPGLRPVYVHIYGTAQSEVDNVIALQDLHQLEASKVWRAAVAQLGPTDLMFVTPSANKLFWGEGYFGSVPAHKVTRAFPSSDTETQSYSQGDNAQTADFYEDVSFFVSLDVAFNKGDGLGAREILNQYLQESGRSMARVAQVRNWLRQLDKRILRNAEQHMESEDWFKAHRELRIVLEGHTNPDVRKNAFKLIRQTGEHLLNEANDAFDRRSWVVAVEEFSEIWLGPHDLANHQLISRRLANSLANLIAGLYREAKHNARRERLFETGDERVALEGAFSHIALLCTIPEAASQDRRRVQMLLEHWQNETNDSETASFVTEALRSLTDPSQRGHAPTAPFAFYVYHVLTYRPGPTYKTGPADQLINSLSINIPPWVADSSHTTVPVRVGCCSIHRAEWNAR